MPRVLTLRQRHAALYYASIVSLGGFLFGFDASVISGAVSFIVPQFGLNDWQLGLVVAAPTLGGIIAAMCGGPLADLVGRRRLLVALALLYTVSAAASAFAPDYAVLVVARFIGGLAFASLSIAPMYIGEIAPREKRGMLISVNQLNIMIGFSVAYFTNYFVLQASQSEATWAQTLAQALGLDHHAWRWMLGIGAFPAIAWFVLLFRVPESPRWLVMQRRHDDARHVLERLKPAYRVGPDLAEIEQSLVDVHERFAQRLREVFLPALRLPLILGLVVAIAQQVTGINAVYFYAPTIFEQSGVGTNVAFAQATLIGIINIVFTVIAMLLIDRLGRKPLLLIGLAGVVLSMALAGYGFHRASYELTGAAAAQLSAEIDRDALRPVINVPFEDDLAFKRALREAMGDQAMREHSAELIQAAIDVDPAIVLLGILGFVASFAVSLGPVMWCLLAEIFPNRARGPAMAFVGFFNSMASFVVQLVFPWELSHLGNATIFFIYASFGVIALLLVGWLLPETKGKSLEELEALLQARA